MDYLRDENYSNLKNENFKFRNPLKHSNQSTMNFKPIFRQNLKENKEKKLLSEKMSDQSLESIDEIRFGENEMERDISMLSVNDASQTCRYFLPSGADFKNEQVRRQFVDDVEARRDANRAVTHGQLRYYLLELARISFDGETGPILIADIVQYQQRLECSCQPLGALFLDGSGISPRTRAAMFELLLEKCCGNNLDRYSAVSAITLADRYVKSKNKVMDDIEYKAIVITCWFISCKFDLLEYPSIKDVCQWAGVLKWQDIGKLEYEILKVTDFYLGIPTPITFLRTLTIIRQRDRISHNIAKCFIEIAICNYSLAGHPAHIIASAAYCLAICLSCRESKLEVSWLPVMQYLFGLDIEDIRPVVITLAKYLRDTKCFNMEIPEIYKEYCQILNVVNMRKANLTEIINNGQPDDNENHEP